MSTDVPTADARDLYAAIGAEIRHARGKRTAESLGDAIDKDQTSISNYERGRGRVALDVLWAIEDELDLQRGQLQVKAGAIAANIVPTNTPVEQAIRDDPRLDDNAKDVVLYAYRYCVSVSKPVDDIAALDDDLARVERDLGITGPPEDGNGEPGDVDDRPA